MPATRFSKVPTTEHPPSTRVYDYSGPATGTDPLVFGSNGMLQSGVLTQPHGSWAGSNSPNIQDAINTGSVVPGVPFVNDCGPGFICSTARTACISRMRPGISTTARTRRTPRCNVIGTSSDRLHADFDAQYVKCGCQQQRYSGRDRLDGQLPVQREWRRHAADALQPGSNVNYAPGGLSNPTNYWIPFIQGHMENDDGHESAFRMDVKYDFDRGGWLDSVKAGVRYADRNQAVRYSTYNWTPIAGNNTCNGPAFSANATTPGNYPGCAAGHAEFLGYGAGIWGTTNFNSFYNGSVYPNGNLVFLNNATSPIFPGWSSL